MSSSSFLFLSLKVRPRIHLSILISVLCKRSSYLLTSCPLTMSWPLLGFATDDLVRWYRHCWWLTVQWSMAWEALSIMSVKTAGAWSVWSSDPVCGFWVGSGSICLCLSNKPLTQSKQRHALKPYKLRLGLLRHSLMLVHGLVVHAYSKRTLWTLQLTSSHAGRCNIFSVWIHL